MTHEGVKIQQRAQNATAKGVIIPRKTIEYFHGSGFNGGVQILFCTTSSYLTGNVRLFLMFTVTEIIRGLGTALVQGSLPFICSKAQQSFVADK